MNDVIRGYKAKTIKAVIRKKVNAWLVSIDDEKVRDLVRNNTIVTGGCIASMLLGEVVNDFDLYFANRATALAVAEYYVGKFKARTGYEMKVDDAGERIRIVTGSGHRGETAGDVTTLTDPGDIEDVYEETKDAARQSDAEDQTDFRPVFLSTNAITLSGKIQVVLRFYGNADEIHTNYDFTHCTNYWTSTDDKLTLRPEALEALLARELRYSGSKYPLCSIMRIRKFVKRGWTINAGQILKMAMQLNELDLKDLAVLEDQLTGVDSMYFMQVLGAIKEKDPEKVNAAYLCEIIDRMF